MNVCKVSRDPNKHTQTISSKSVQSFSKSSVTNTRGSEELYNIIRIEIREIFINFE